MPQASLSGRGAVRHNLEAHITVESQSNFYAGFTRNISEGGVFVSMENPPQRGEIVRLTVTLGDGRAVAATGEVRWHRLDENDRVVGCGVQFVALDPASTAALQSMLEECEQDPLLME